MPGSDHEHPHGDLGRPGPTSKRDRAAARPARRGAMLAIGAALLFGASTPLVQRAGAGLGPFSTAALLYAGAALLGMATRERVSREAQVRRSDLGRLAAMAWFGAVVGPVCLTWGLQHSSGSASSLMLTLEAVFTAGLARLWYGEALGRRAGVAMLLITAGGMSLVMSRGVGAPSLSLGLVAVLLATLAWAFDNTLSRALAERDPAQVVAAKSVLGVAATAAIAVAMGEPLPRMAMALALVAIGAAGYGLSLRFYLLAQRAFGAARTGSVFAFAPFIGAALAPAMGEAGWSLNTAIGGALMLAGVLMHIAERHQHVHWHEQLTHEHAHRHDDHHHGHGHENEHERDHDHDHDHAHEHEHEHATHSTEGSHSHRHTHEPGRHEHAHVPDAHHTHAH